MFINYYGYVIAPITGPRKTQKMKTGAIQNLLVQRFFLFIVQISKEKSLKGYPATMLSSAEGDAELGGAQILSKAQVSQTNNSDTQILTPNIYYQTTEVRQNSVSCCILFSCSKLQDQRSVVSRCPLPSKVTLKYILNSTITVNLSIIKRQCRMQRRLLIHIFQIAVLCHCVRGSDRILKNSYNYKKY